LPDGVRGQLGRNSGANDDTTRHLSGRGVRVLAIRLCQDYSAKGWLGFENMEIKKSLKKYLSPLRSFPSKLIDIFSMPHALNFYQLQFNDDFKDNAIKDLKMKCSRVRAKVPLSLTLSPPGGVRE
jgi:hypothetical protein